MSNYLGDQSIPLNLRKQVADCALNLAESRLALSLAPTSLRSVAALEMQRDEVALNTAITIAARAYLGTQ